MRRLLAVVASGVLVFACSSDEFTPESNGANGQLELVTGATEPLPPLGVGLDAYVELRRHERGETVCEARGCGGEHCVTPRRYTAVEILSLTCRDEGCDVAVREGRPPGRVAPPEGEVGLPGTDEPEDYALPQIVDLAPHTQEDRLVDESAGTPSLRVRATTAGPKRVAVRARLADGEIVEDEFLFRGTAAALRVIEGLGDVLDGRWFGLDEGRTPIVVGAKLRGCARVGEADLGKAPHLTTLPTYVGALSVGVEGEGALVAGGIDPDRGCFSLDAAAPGRAELVLRADALERRVALEVVGESDVRAVELRLLPAGKLLLEPWELAAPGGLTELPAPKAEERRRVAVVLRLADGRGAFGLASFAEGQGIRLAPVKYAGTSAVTPYLDLPAFYPSTAAVRVTFGSHTVVVPARAP